MQRFRSSFSLCLLAFTIFLTAAASSAQAQVQRFDNANDWRAAITGVVSDGLGALTVVDDTTTCLELDPALGQFEGFLLQTNTFFPPTISLFDGDTLVQTVALMAGDSPFDLDDGFSYGWINTDELEVTKIVIEDNTPGSLIINTFDISTIPDVVEPPAETCFDELGAVKSEIEALLATATGDDALYLQCALNCICWTQQDCFWVQPSGDRLSVYGSSVFLANAYTVCYLERVADPQSDVIIDQLLDVLECIVDKEIEYAIANGGTQCYIDRAADYAELGDIIDDDFDNQVIATLAYRLAWLNAYYSTY